MLVVNTHSANITVTIAPDPLGDADANVVTLGAGDTVAVIYHPDNGWLFLAAVLLHRVTIIKQGLRPLHNDL